MPLVAHEPTVTVDIILLLGDCAGRILFTVTSVLFYVDIDFRAIASFFRLVFGQVCAIASQFFLANCVICQRYFLCRAGRSIVQAEWAPRLRSGSFAIYTNLVAIRIFPSRNVYGNGFSGCPIGWCV